MLNPGEIPQYEIRDPDLTSKLEGATALTLPRLRMILSAEQQRRDTKAAERAAMTREPW